MERYEGVFWKDTPSKQTPITAKNLNKMDKGVIDVTEMALDHDAMLDGFGDVVNSLPIRRVETGTYTITSSETGWRTATCTFAKAFDEPPFVILQSTSAEPTENLYVSNVTKNGFQVNAYDDPNPGTWTYSGNWIAFSVTGDEESSVGIDTDLSFSSVNPVQNRTITKAIRDSDTKISNLETVVNSLPVRRVDTGKFSIDHTVPNEWKSEHFDFEEPFDELPVVVLQHGKPGKTGDRYAQDLHVENVTKTGFDIACWYIGDFHWTFAGTWVAFGVTNKANMSFTVDGALDEFSLNPVTNKAVTAAINEINKKLGDGVEASNWHEEVMIGGSKDSPGVKMTYESSQHRLVISVK